MLINYCEQGTEEWHRARLGIPTASNFDRIMTASGKPSTQAEAYQNQLVAEWYTGETTNGYINDAMQRGIELEPLAREAYEFATDSEVEQVGFVYKDADKLCGCSPDGLLVAFDLRFAVAQNGKGLEIKCPLPGTHVSYLLAGGLPSKYVGQLQGSMYVTGLELWDFCSYCPGFPPLIITVERDEDYIDKLRPLLDDFIGTMLEKRAKLTEILGGK